MTIVATSLPVGFGSSVVTVSPLAPAPVGRDAAGEAGTVRFDQAGDGTVEFPISFRKDRA